MRFLIQLLGVIFSLSMFITLRDTYVFKVNPVLFRTKKLPTEDELTILQITDMHNKRAWGIHQRLLKKVDTLRPDIIVLTGDLIDRKSRNFKKILVFIEELTKKDIPVLFVAGNHEWGNLRKKSFLQGLKKRNVIVLENESIEFPLSSSNVTIVGIDDTSTQHENIKKAFQHAKTDQFTLLLSHSPYFIKKYLNLPVDLILSGHTHGGQIRFPFIGSLVSPGGGVFPELDKGVFELEYEKYIYVDSGLGTSMIPVRFLNQSQISLIKIKGDH